MEPVEIILRRRIQLAVVGLAQSQQIFEEVIIGEQRGEVLAILISIVICNQLAVDSNVSTLRNVKTRQQFCECGLAATVAADDPDRFSGVQSQIEWTKGEVTVFRV